MQQHRSWSGAPRITARRPCMGRHGTTSDVLLIVRIRVETLRAQDHHATMHY